MALKSSNICFESYFCEVNVTNDESAKHDVWSPRYPNFSGHSFLPIICTLVPVDKVSRIMHVDDKLLIHMVSTQTKYMSNI
jgi:hypothetical protein